MGYILGITLALAIAIYVLMNYWWVALAAGLGWLAGRLVRDQLASRQGRRVDAADDLADLRQRADEGHAAYMRGEPTF